MTRRAPLLTVILVAFILVTTAAEAAGEPCGAGAGNACATDEFCKLPVGDCGSSGVAGVCTPRPQDCPAVYDPVCGCDGATYGNECEADQAGAPIASPGACEPACGGLAGITCDAGEYCRLPPGFCNVQDLGGVCVPLPAACPEVYAPVCGCDGVTYDNPCFADAAGAQIDHEGTCELRICGTIAGLTCNSDEFCLFPDHNCDTADAAGVCVPVPQACPLYFDPVCGCDGKTYGNRCEAVAAGVQVDRPGECGPQVCGGLGAVPCDDGEFCKLPDGTCPALNPPGICQPIPDACPEIYDPVCGCDGQTYSNSCFADMAGAPISHEGECVQVCGGIAGIPCDDGEFCKLPAGQCDVTDLQGTCQPFPTNCPLFFDPVCGCDGVTYSNECEADQAGAQIDHPGQCDRVCGGIAGIPCESGEYCQFPDGTCDIADNQGVCRPIPQGCPDVVDPVCGCDGVTYGNRCEAEAVGAQVAHEGECPPEFCGGFGGKSCSDPDDFCLYPDGSCNSFDPSGGCVSVPQSCPAIYDPVCGCDGTTYDNRCEALVAGVQVDHAGECPPAVCGGIAGIPCEDGEFCKLPDGQCDVADLQGICQPIPEACPEIYDPVCGCDGTTYSNSCFADQAGAQIDHAGECEPQVCGGIAGIPCDDEEFCKLPAGECESADLQGVCTPVPVACPLFFDPVCGCDGVTYDNECDADRAGAQIDHPGVCDRVCGGIAGIPCEEDEYCMYPDGTCEIADNQGVCRPIPQACPDVWDPVCGCDGQTYGNRCEAAAQGVSIESEGECVQVCGGIAGLPCDDGEFCKLPSGECESADLLGVCTPVPLACPLFFDPVCGCDGVTYDNECDADRAGAQIDHDGPCEQVCGGFSGIVCDEGEYCSFPDGTCNIQDLSGVCRPIPDACPDVYDPVCGCDGVTYGNRCEAAAAQAQIASEGECERVCGGFTGIPCDDGEYCMFPNGTCNFADHLGTCVPIPDLCPEVCHPVCGCDGVTYGNLCLAQQAQVSLDHRGECDPAGRLVEKVRFDSHERMRWQPAPGAMSYNIYVEVHKEPPPEDAGECYLSGVNPAGVIIAPFPNEGEAWLIQVTGVFSDGEGPMGMSSDCTFRAPEAPCDPQ